MALFLEVEIGDAVRIGDGTVVRLEAKSGKRARLRIESRDDVNHIRGGDAAGAGLQRPTREAPAPEPAEKAAAPKRSIFRRAVPA